MTSQCAPMFRGLSRWHWRNWPVLVKLVASVLVPTLVALAVGVPRIVDQSAAASGFTRISQLAGVAQQLSGLLDAIGRERDLATVFVASGRSGDQGALQAQFRTVDSRGAAVRTAAEQVDGLAPTGYATVLDQLRGLRPLRQSVLTGTGPAGAVVAEYGAAAEPLIGLDAALVRQGAAAFAAASAAAHALLAAREQVGRQHAIVLAALITGRIRPPEISDVQAAALRLAALQQEFASALDPAQRAGYVARATGDAELSRQRLLQQVLDRGLAKAALDVAPSDWDGRTEAAVEDIAGVQTELRQWIIRTALALRDDARAGAGWNAVILLFALALGVLIAVLLARSMRRPLGVLRRTALDVARLRLPSALARVRAGAPPDNVIEPVAVSTREEIGQLAWAFDEVHRQAVRLVGEQAMTGAHGNDIVVNLARRSQGLVERQLQVIDQLERGELDPRQLANLFQLDHLATRMRRNSDNLLVLAGTEVGKRSSRPVRLVDVLRASVSEVEQYQRLVLQQPPGVVVLGGASGDLVHLLAELVDNATQFSPPDTPVILRAESAEDGSLQIEVTDRGVGMTGPELAEVNERLASTPVVNASVSRRMGLFVVGRLAVRHGIRVRLDHAADGVGVGARVIIPPGLVRSASEVGPGLSGVTVLPREPPAAMGGYLTNGNGAGQAPKVAPSGSTPIFDDVASAWFQGHHKVPVRWLATPPPADLGGAGERWRAAQAVASLAHAQVSSLARDPVNAELTASGLPRRTPRALLVPGAADQAQPAMPRIGPVRSAELIRGRLASYQRGIREGRRTRREQGCEPNVSIQRQEIEEETT